MKKTTHQRLHFRATEKRLETAKINPSAAIYEALAVNNPLPIPQRIQNAKNTIEEQLIADPLGIKSTDLTQSLEDMVFINQQMSSYIDLPSHSWIRIYLDVAKGPIEEKTLSSEEKIQVIGMAAAHEYRATGYEILARFHHPDNVTAADPSIRYNKQMLKQTKEASDSYTTHAAQDWAVVFRLQPNVKAEPVIIASPPIHEEPVKKAAPKKTSKLSVADYIAHGTKHLAENRIQEGLEDFGKALEKEPENPQARFGDIYVSLRRTRNLETTLAAYPDLPTLEAGFTRKQKGLWNQLKEQLKKERKTAEQVSLPSTSNIVTLHEPVKTDTTITLPVQILDEKDTQGWIEVGNKKPAPTPSLLPEPTSKAEEEKKKIRPIPPETPKLEAVIKTESVIPLGDLTAFPSLPSSKVSKLAQRVPMIPESSSRQVVKLQQELVPNVAQLVPIISKSPVQTLSSQSEEASTDSAASTPPLTPQLPTQSAHLIPSTTSVAPPAASQACSVPDPNYFLMWQQCLATWQYNLTQSQQQLYNLQPYMTESVRSRLREVYDARISLPANERFYLQYHAATTGNRDIAFLLDAHQLLANGVLSEAETKLFCNRIFSSHTSHKPPILLSDSARWPKDQEWKTLLHIASSQAGPRTQEATNFVQHYIIPCLENINPQTRSHLIGRTGNLLFKRLTSTEQSMTR